MTETNLNTTGSIGTDTSIYDYKSYCADRLPCGICRRTGTTCPLGQNIYSPSWVVPYPTISSVTGNVTTLCSDDSALKES